ncbi:MAG: type IV pilus assembly protein PilM [Candidatus Chaera renei]|uniref:Type IV pilus assembly protein PilM n=1 Tax=Candidatus Chaera renei TaxID=2506947 RepID=A0A4Q0AJZ4_9BACT|nr:MAG: type IV pilus assembly protein PilM [Candidatus Chaera renei]
MGVKPKLFHHDKPVSGIDISQTGVKVMAIDVKRWAVEAYGSLDLDPAKLQESINTGNSYLTEGLEKLLTAKLSGKLPSNQVVLSVPTSRTYTRSMTLPRDAEKNLKEAVLLEAEQYIPIAPAELNIDYQVIERGAKELTVLMSAVPKKIVASITNAAAQIGLEVVLVEPGLSAVARLITQTEEGHLPTVIVDIGAGSTDIAVLDKAIRVTGGVPVGGNSFTLDIARKLKVSLENAHQLKVLNGLSSGVKQAKILAALKPDLDQIAAEVQKMVRYYIERLGAKRKVEQVIIVGGGGNVPGLGDYFTDTLIMPARVASPWQVLNFGRLPQPSRQFKPRYITAAGLACVQQKEIWQ